MNRKCDVNYLDLCLSFFPRTRKNQNQCDHDKDAHSTGGARV